MRKAKLVYVEYDDHASGSGWREQHEIDPTPLTIVAIGWIAQKTKKVLVLAASVDGRTGPGTKFDMIVSARVYIVRSCITKYKVLKNPCR